MRTTCCLNLPPPTSNQPLNASLLPTKPPQVSLVKTSWNWRRQCVLVGVASYCSMIGLELFNLSSMGHEAIAADEIIMNTMESSSNSPSISLIRGGGGGGGSSGSNNKWSKKRACPPWRGNSLETIVPENLPRPAARRRYELVGSTSMTAPPVSAETVILGSNDKESCFSM